MTAAPPQPRNATRAHALAREFAEFLPASSVLVEEEDLRPYECDGLTAYRQLPLLVVLPDTVEQVQRVMRLCSDRQTSGGCTWRPGLDCLAARCPWRGVSCSAWHDSTASSM